MGKTVAEVFGTEKNSALAAVEIFAMRIDMENRTVEAKIAPAKTVHKSEIYTLQSKICEKLGIQNVRLVPVYSPSLLGDDYFGDIAAEAVQRTLWRWQARNRACARWCGHSSAGTLRQSHAADNPRRIRHRGEGRFLRRNGG